MEDTQTDAEVAARLAGEPGAAPGAAPAPPAPPTHDDLHVDRSAGEAAPRRRVLLPVDDTPDAEAALEWAIANLYRAGDVFHLFTCVPEPHMVAAWRGSYAYVPPDDEEELREVEGAKAFAAHRFGGALLAARVPFQLHVCVAAGADSAAVADRVVRKAAALGGECVVVMARHSAGRLKRLALGSVTAAVVARCAAPVVVVPPRG